MVEAWLRGPMEGVDPVLQPAAFALVQSREDIEAAAADLSADDVRARPGGVASVGYHLTHLAGSIDRLLTYGRGGTLSDEQKRTLAAEREAPASDATAATLVRDAQAAIDRALVALRAADPAMLHEPRHIGRAQLPSTLFGVLFHIAEHAARHTGQIVTTARIVRSR